MWCRWSGLKRAILIGYHNASRSIDFNPTVRGLGSAHPDDLISAQAGVEGVVRFGSVPALKHFDASNIFWRRSAIHRGGLDLAGSQPGWLIVGSSRLFSSTSRCAKLRAAWRRRPRRRPMHQGQPLRATGHNANLTQRPDAIGDLVPAWMEAQQPDWRTPQSPMQLCAGPSTRSGVMPSTPRRY